MEMTDTTFDLRKAYVDLLTGQLTAFGKSVPIYSFKALKAENVVVVISTISEAEDPANKDLYGKLVTVNVDVQHYITGTGAVTTQPVDSVGSQIQRLLQPSKASGSPLDLGDPWRIIRTELQLANHLHSNTATGQLMRKIMVFQHLVKQIG